MMSAGEPEIRHAMRLGARACDSLAWFGLRQRKQIDLLARLLFALHFEEREGAHRLARTARMQAAKCLADRPVLEGTAHGDQGIARMVAERDGEGDLLLCRLAGGGEVGRAEALVELPSQRLDQRVAIGLTCFDDLRQRRPAERSHAEKSAAESCA